MADTALRFVGPKELDTSTQVEYTVPALTKGIIRDIQFLNTSGGALTVFMSIGADADATRYYKALSVDAGGFFHVSLFIVMEAAEELELHASGAGITATISGVEVS